MLKTIWIAETNCYDGSQLHSHFAYRNWKVMGDSVVSWQGPCQIPSSNIVDGEDLLAGQTICGDQMLHFIVELFNQSLGFAVLVQRVFAGLVLEICRKESQSLMAPELYRRGDDIYYQNQKLSISVATISPVSALIHFGINISNEGTPVKTLCLKDLCIDPYQIALRIMEALAEELKSAHEATQKVFWVK